jgi:hypothetical protein
MSKPNPCMKKFKPIAEVKFSTPTISSTILGIRTYAEAKVKPKIEQTIGRSTQFEANTGIKASESPQTKIRKLNVKF